MKPTTLIILASMILTACVTADPRRQQYVTSHPELSVREKDCVSAGTMCKGLTQEAVRLIWGNPTTVNQVHGQEGEQWVFDGQGQFNGSSDYVNFDKDGRVKDWSRIQ